jgi:hypothetical protein
MTIGVDFSGDLPDGKAIGLGIFVFWSAFSILRKIKENGKKNSKIRILIFDIFCKKT